MRPRRLLSLLGGLLLSVFGPFLGSSIGAQRGPASRPSRVPSTPSTRPTPATSARAQADYPFVHAEQTPDVLGPYFGPTSDGRPPNVVVILVEGLGRSFSGLEAPLGSFTPFLDELARKSLYFEHFLANQGRTFGVLPSMFGSLPMAAEGFTALGNAMPAHAGLFNVLKRQGYRTSFYTGTNLDFDEFRTFLRREGVDDLVDATTFGAGYPSNPLSEWGYADRELVSRVLADNGRLTAPFVTGVLTISMHPEYRFPGQDAYLAAVEARLQTLGIPESRRARYRGQADIYSAILYTDDQLRRYFEGVATAPWYANTIFVITGDHRLAEIPQDTYVERFHVPLVIYSPLLRRAARIGAVSSHLDVTPSLLALLSHTYGLQRPAQVTWTGSGLDVGANFRNGHEIPLKLTKSSGLDYVSGRWFLHGGQLFELQEGLRTVEATDAGVRTQVAQRLQGYTTANTRFLQQKTLSPEGDAPQLIPFRTAPAAPASPAVAELAPGVGIDEARVTVSADSVRVRIAFTNGDGQTTAPIVPLVLLLDEDGRELREGYGTALRLAARTRREVTVAIPTPTTGRYLLSVWPSDPKNGKPVGRGRYRIPVDVPPTP